MSRAKKLQLLQTESPEFIPLIDDLKGRNKDQIFCYCNLAKDKLYKLNILQCVNGYSRDYCHVSNAEYVSYNKISLLKEILLLKYV